MTTVSPRPVPALLSFDVFGTLISVREGSYAAFRSILADAGGQAIDVRAFWEHSLLRREFDLRCTAEKAGGYKPDGTLFRYLLAEASGRFGVGLEGILHAGQSQHTDMVGAKPLGLRVAWINRRGVPLHPSVPRPDHQLADLASLPALLGEGSQS